jgi:hypothetical protein
MTIASRSVVMPRFLMKNHATLPWPRLSLGAAVVMLASFTVSASPPPHVKVVASQRRIDLTAGGIRQRVGMLRQQQRTQRMIEKQAQAPGSKKK